jgi:hypothetical protein
MAPDAKVSTLNSRAKLASGDSVLEVRREETIVPTILCALPSPTALRGVYRMKTTGSSLTRQMILLK